MIFKCSNAGGSSQFSGENVFFSKWERIFLVRRAEIRLEKRLDDWDVIFSFQKSRKTAVFNSILSSSLSVP